MEMIAPAVRARLSEGIEIGPLSIGEGLSPSGRERLIPVNAVLAPMAMRLVLPGFGGGRLGAIAQPGALVEDG